ncbi:DUF5360 family protein [Pelorhabdus rhamnosifermentans]|uniref:DUF5360 family protein n=1 Tax=Pelorhabdus rhamnosifermentans TaxID=2772457 RepID=UPI001C05FB9B
MNLQVISISGLMSLYFYKKNVKWEAVSLISLVLTFCSGLQAIAFWILRLDFDLSWWISNLYLVLYPLYFIPKLIGKL